MGVSCILPPILPIVARGGGRDNEMHGCGHGGPVDTRGGQERRLGTRRSPTARPSILQGLEEEEARPRPRLLLVSVMFLPCRV